MCFAAMHTASRVVIARSPRQDVTAVSRTISGRFAARFREIRRTIPGRRFSNSGKKRFVVFRGFRCISFNSGKFAATFREVRRTTPGGSPSNSGRSTAILWEACAFPRYVCLLGVCAGISRVGACAEYHDFIVHTFHAAFYLVDTALRVINK